MAAGAEKMRNAFKGAAAADTPLTLLPKRTRAEMRTRRLRFVCPEARALPRGLLTDITAFSGVGKTRFLTQWLAELCLGLAPFGEETLRPATQVSALYIGAEDREELFNELTFPLLADDNATLPFDVLLLEDREGGFTLDAPGAQQLAAFAHAHGPFDVIALDPLSALVPEQYADAMKNGFLARQWQRLAFGPLRTACPDAAIIVAAHDTKSGTPLSGSGDFIAFARAVLHLRAGGSDGVPEDVPEGSIELSRFNDNCGFRHKRMILERDPHTLLLTVTKTEAAYGAAARPARRTQAEVEQYLATQALRFLQPSPALESERTRARVEAVLMSATKRDGLDVSTRNLGRFLEAFCTWRLDRQGRSTVKILEDVRDPSEAERRRYGD